MRSSRGGYGGRFGLGFGTGGVNCVPPPDGHRGELRVETLSEDTESITEQKAREGKRVSKGPKSQEQSQ